MLGGSYEETTMLHSTGMKIKMHFARLVLLLDGSAGLSFVITAHCYHILQ
jgi:hypothetical protein